MGGSFPGFACAVVCATADIHVLFESAHVCIGVCLDASTSTHAGIDFICVNRTAVLPEPLRSLRNAEVFAHGR